MTSRDFCYWLQGMFELGDPSSFSIAQMRSIKGHLALVFKHEIDPSAGPQLHQDELNKIHAAIKAVDKEMEKTQAPKIGGTAPDGTVYRC